MQTADKNKSHLIRLTESQKKKSRHRLIGSIFLLLIALVVLLQVTSKVHQIELQSKHIIIEVKNTASTPIAVVTPAKIQAQLPLYTSSVPVNTAPINTVVPASATVKVAVVKLDASNTQYSPQSKSLKPRLIVEQVKVKPSPEDILNGQDSTMVASRYYVQLLASVDRNKLIQVQDSLANKGTKTIIQSVDTPSGMVYRLRIGPFSDKDGAQRVLDTLMGTSVDE